MTNTIAWETYSNAGILTSVSKYHVIDENSPSYTLCGVYIADKQDTNHETDACKACERKRLLSLIN